MPLEDLPLIDEHAADVGAPPHAVWDAVLRTMETAFSGVLAAPLVRLLGCEPQAGSTIPGWGIVAAERPALLAVAGRHRFSRYGIVFRIEPSPAGARCRAESRAAFDGVHGRLYRLAVVGSGGHVVAVRRLLAQVRRTAEALPDPAAPLL